MRPCGCSTSPVQPSGERELPGLGLSTTYAHSRFLDRYSVENGCAFRFPWHSVRDDGYLYDHLVWHLEKAGRAEEIHDLLWAENAEGKNGWFETRDRLGQTPGYLADLERAWKLADDDFARDRSPTAMLQQAALRPIRSSCLSMSIRVDLLEQLVGVGMWNPEMALTYARCIPSEDGHIEPGSCLLPYLDPTIRDSIKCEALKSGAGNSGQKVTLMCSVFDHTTPR